MGKGAILKDSRGRPGGYLREAEGGFVCRADISGPAQAAVVFEDGMQELYPVDSRAEQFIPCAEKRLLGAYVFCGEELLLSTDERARAAFLNSLARQKRQAEKAKEMPAGTERTEVDQPESGGSTWHAFPQRRWPPPPCWAAACYLHGRWME